MFIAFVVIASVVALMVIYSAALKLTHREEVVENYARAGVPESWLNGLATLLFAAAAALLAGIWWPVAGLAASAGLAGYFMIASIFHVRAKDTANVAMPAILTLLAGAALTLRLWTL